MVRVRAAAADLGQHSSEQQFPAPVRPLHLSHVLHGCCSSACSGRWAPGEPGHAGRHRGRHRDRLVMMENSPIIINRYRARDGFAGLYRRLDRQLPRRQHELRDRVLYRAQLGLWRSCALFFVVELLMLWLMRDNLTLNVLMLLWPTTRSARGRAAAEPYSLSPPYSGRGPGRRVGCAANTG